MVSQGQVKKEPDKVERKSILSATTRTVKQGVVFPADAETQSAKNRYAKPPPRSHVPIRSSQINHPKQNPPTKHPIPATKRQRRPVTKRQGRLATKRQGRLVTKRSV